MDWVQRARDVVQYQGDPLRYFDENWKVQARVLDAVLPDRLSKYKFWAHFRYYEEETVKRLFLAYKVVPLDRVLLPSEDPETIRRKKHGNCDGQNAQGRQTRNSFQYYSHYYKITSWENFKTGDEVVWTTYSGEDGTCIGKIVVTGERDSVSGGSDWLEVAVVSLENVPKVNESIPPGHYPYLDMKNTFVVPMKYLLKFSEWVTVKTNELNDQWKTVTYRKGGGNKGKQRPVTEYHDDQRHRKDFEGDHNGGTFPGYSGGGWPEFTPKHPNRPDFARYPDLSKEHLPGIPQPKQRPKSYHGPTTDDDLPIDKNAWKVSLNKTDFLKLAKQADGKSMGIQGNNNSCYIDSSFFALFAFCDKLDSLLSPERYDNVEETHSKLMQNVRDCIIYPLRQNFYVPHKDIRKFRKILASITTTEEYRSRFMDVEEFLQDFFKFLNAPAFLQFDNDEGDYIHQIALPFTWEKDEFKPYITLQSLLENSFETFGVKLCEMPDNIFVIKLPVSDGVLIPCDGVIPNLTLDLRNVMTPQQGQDTSMTMTLHAVICLRHNHFVAFVRTGKSTKSPWVYMDSKPTIQQPYVFVLPDIGQIIENALEELESGEEPRNIAGYEPECEDFSLFRHAYMCIYVQSS